MLSRRRFLQLAGIAVVSAHLPRVPSITPRFDAVYGRALGTVPLYAAPHTDAPLVTRLWSDTVVPILGADDSWVRLRRGYTPRENLQPMIAPAQRSASSSAPPFWGEVCGAIAVVHVSCAVSAPVVARIGHGGVLHVIDWLPDEDGDWYGVADANDDLLGWSLAAGWSLAEVDWAFPELTLVVDRTGQRLDVRDNSGSILSAPISTGRELVPGVYRRLGQRESAQFGDHHGAAWITQFEGDLDLAGVYWHNAFGTPTPARRCKSCRRWRNGSFHTPQQ